MNELSALDASIIDLDPQSLTNLLLFGSKFFSKEVNAKIISLSIKYIKDTKRFDGPLL